MKKEECERRDDATKEKCCRHRFDKSAGAGVSKRDATFKTNTKEEIDRDDLVDRIRDADIALKSCGDESKDEDENRYRG